MKKALLSVVVLTVALGSQGAEPRIVPPFERDSSLAAANSIDALVLASRQATGLAHTRCGLRRRSPPS